MKSSMPIVLKRLLRVACVAILAIVIASCMTSGASAQSPSTAPARATATTQPIFVAATASDIWVLQRTTELLDTRTITIIRRMSTGPQSDARFYEADTLRGDVVDVATAGDRLVVLFADGSWGWIAPGSSFTAGQSLDRGVVPVAVAGQGEALWFLCRRAAAASTAPAAEPEAAWLLLKRERTGAVSRREALTFASGAARAGVAVAANGDVVVAFDGSAFCLPEGKLTKRDAIIDVGFPGRLVPLDGWPVAAVLTGAGAGVQLIEWNGNTLADPVRLQLDESIAKDRWAVTVANGELRFLGRQGFTLVDQILKRDGTAVRAPQPLQIVPGNRAPPGAEAMQLAIMLTLGAVVLIVWLRASRPGAAGVPTLDDRPAKAAGSPSRIATPAPLTARCLAASIDYMPVWLVIGISMARQSDPVATQAIIAAAVVGYIVYCTVCEIVFGRTIGKRMLRLRVATITGDKPGIAAIALRNALRIVEALPPFMAFAVFSMMVTPMRQRLGDFVSGTTVVADEPEREPAGSTDDSVQNPSGRADDRESK